MHSQHRGVENVTIMDMKYLGSCPAGMKPGAGRSCPTARWSAASSIRSFTARGAGGMSIRFGAALVMAMALAVAAHSARAHHSVAGEFDVRKIIRLNGVVSDVEWANP